ncbi:MAG: hypothetical protein V7K68_14800, partial [Nostoc sp.]|uniref:hypothetical protein n=1 Tax=Nostoc sp. TaxID=1180 RepID=UPI002FF7C9A2
QLFANEIFTFKEISLQINIYCFAANNNVKDLQMRVLLPQNCLTCETNCKFVWNVTCVTVYISKSRLKYLSVEIQSYAIPCTTF